MLEDYLHNKEIQRVPSKVFELLDKLNVIGGEEEGKRKEKTMTKKFDSLLQILKQNFSHTKCMRNWSKIVLFRKILTR